MKIKLFLIAAVCCILLGGQAKAQSVWTYSAVQYPCIDSTRICGNGYMEVDYSSQLYYNLEIMVTIWDATSHDYNLLQYNNAYTGSTWLCAAPDLPYNSTHEYISNMTPSVSAYFIREEDGALVDHYNFGYYLGEPILWPGAAGGFGFLGMGPEVSINYGSIVLGALTGLHLQGQTSDVPHHLQVIWDTDITLNDAGDCGQLQKRINFSIVDYSNHKAGRAAISERPQPGLKDSCSNKEPKMSIKCSAATVDNFGFFTDFLSTGCPTIGGSCGLFVMDVWRWCIPDGANGSICDNLAMMEYDVKYSIIKVDGASDIPELVYKYAPHYPP